MTQAQPQAAAPYVLPSALIGQSDLSKLLRELEEIDNNLESQKARKLGSAGHYKLPSMSHNLSEFLESNKIDLTNDHVRMELKVKLRKVKDHAPVLHMTFATEVDRESLEYIVSWTRKELHPQTLITVGLQPSLIAGVYVRTPNHVHDYSVRATMKDSRNLIVQSLDELTRSAGV